MITLLPAVGCSSFGKGKLVQELQNDNERLLTEFRAERDRREKTEQALSRAESRLAESEKLLARKYQGTQSGRLSRLQASPLTSTPQTPFSTDLKGVSNDSALDQDTGLRWQRRVSK